MVWHGSPISGLVSDDCNACSCCIAYVLIGMMLTICNHTESGERNCAVLYIQRSLVRQEGEARCDPIRPHIE